MRSIHSTFIRGTSLCGSLLSGCHGNNAGDHGRTCRVPLPWAFSALGDLSVAVTLVEEEFADSAGYSWGKCFAMYQ